MTQRTTAHHRAVRRPAIDDNAALDYAYDAGQYAREVEVLRSQLEGERRRAAGFLNSTPFLVFAFLLCVAAGVAIAPRFYTWYWAIEPATADVPLGTAEIAPRPTRPPPAQDNSAAVNRDIAAYNAAQQATAEALQAAQDAPTATEAAPPAENAAASQDAPAETPMPEPGAPGFADSFQPAQCSAMITYLRGHPCYGRAGQAPLPEPGSDAFADSFK